MELTWIQFCIVCPLVFLGGFVDAVAGGGGLISLPSYLLAGLPVHASIATNKLSSGMGTTIATIRYAKSGFINWKRAVFCIVCALIGSNIGAHIALLISDYIFKILMLFIIPVTAFYVLKTKNFDKKSEKNISEKKIIMISMGIALVIGAYDGFYGPGTGTFLILLLTGLAQMKLQEANGICKTINLTTNLTSLAVYLLNGKVIIVLGLVAGLFGIAGNYLGAKFFTKGGVKAVRPIMLIVLVIFFGKIIGELL